MHEINLEVGNVISTHPSNPHHVGKLLIRCLLITQTQVLNKIVGEYLQIDLLNYTEITAVATQVCQEKYVKRTTAWFYWFCHLFSVFSYFHIYNRL